MNIKFDKIKMFNKDSGGYFYDPATERKIKYGALRF